jgi:hypothetical protein
MSQQPPELEEIFLLEVVVGAILSAPSKKILSSCTLPAVSCRFLDFAPFVVHYFSAGLVNEIKEKAAEHNVQGDALQNMVRDVLSFSPEKVVFSLVIHSPCRPFSIEESLVCLK